MPGYVARSWVSDDRATYEYLSESGGYVIAGMAIDDLKALCDELDASGETQAAWERVLRRWADGYRPVTSTN